MKKLVYTLTAIVALLSSCVKSADEQIVVEKSSTVTIECVGMVKIVFDCTDVGETRIARSKDGYNFTLSDEDFIYAPEGLYGSELYHHFIDKFYVNKLCLYTC